MWLKKCLLFLFLTQISFSQSLSLEDKIYNAIDTFIAKPTAENINNLNITEKEFWKNQKPKTKDDLLAIVILNSNKAYYEKQFNQVQKAVSSYEKAWKTYKKYNLSNYDIIEYCLKPLGNLYTLLGDYDNAENTIKQYYYIATKEKNKQQQFAAVVNLSNVYQNSGKNDWAVGNDHTGNANGNMFLVNAGTGGSVFFSQQVDNLCPGSKYNFSASNSDFRC